MLKFVYSFVLLFLITNSFANNKENIVNNLKNTNSINFKFEQNINQKLERGNCTVQYPKKIFCKYDNFNNKILVSNGKSLIIKTQSGSYYRYSLKRTPLNYILDKNFLSKSHSKTCGHSTKSTTSSNNFEFSNINNFFLLNIFVNSF